MDTTEIKSKIRDLIDQETDTEVLEAIKTILEKTHLDPVLRKKLTRRALEAEDDISQDQVYTEEEVIEETDGVLDA